MHQKLRKSNLLIFNKKLFLYKNTTIQRRVRFYRIWAVLFIAYAQSYTQELWKTVQTVDWQV